MGSTASVIHSCSRWNLVAEGYEDHRNTPSRPVDAVETANQVVLLGWIAFCGQLPLGWQCGDGRFAHEAADYWVLGEWQAIAASSGCRRRKQRQLTRGRTIGLCAATSFRPRTALSRSPQERPLLISRGRCSGLSSLLADCACGGGLWTLLGGPRKPRGVGGIVRKPFPATC